MDPVNEWILKLQQSYYINARTHVYLIKGLFFVSMRQLSVLFHKINQAAIKAGHVV